MLDRIVYKIMSPVDIADGYIHLSCGSQLAATLDKHYGGVESLMLADVDLSRLGDTVRWEPARGGRTFMPLAGRSGGVGRAAGANP